MFAAITEMILFLACRSLGSSFVFNFPELTAQTAFPSPFAFPFKPFDSCSDQAFVSPAATEAIFKAFFRSISINRLACGGKESQSFEYTLSFSFPFFIGDGNRFRGNV